MHQPVDTDDLLDFYISDTMAHTYLVTDGPMNENAGWSALEDLHARLQALRIVTFGLGVLILNNEQLIAEEIYELYMEAGGQLH